MIEILQISGFTDKGIRENNEDYILYNTDSRIIVLCDGMGGHGHGEVASSTVAESVYNYLKILGKQEYESTDLQDALNCAITQLNQEDIFEDDRKMGTTLVVVVVNKMNILVGHVGDSRCYLFDKDCLKKFRTKDHSKVQEAVDAEILTEEEAYNNPHKNILTRCVIAGKDKINIEVDDLKVENGDKLFLCSDGVVDAMRDKEIQEILMNRNIYDSLELIKNKCKEGSHDNFSAILVDLSQDEIPKVDNVPSMLEEPDILEPTYRHRNENVPSNQEPASSIPPSKRHLLYGVLGGFLMGMIIAAAIAYPLCRNAIAQEQTKGISKVDSIEKAANRYKTAVDRFINSQCDTTVKYKKGNKNGKPILTLEKTELSKAYKEFKNK